MANYIITIDLSHDKFLGFPVESAEVPTTAKTLEEAQAKGERMAQRLSSYQKGSPVPPFTIREVSS